MTKHPLRALILDDSDDDVVLLVRALRQQGYDDVAVRRADSTSAMNAALDAEAWDVVLSDYSMPELSVTGALGILAERKLDLPFIVVTGSVGEETAAAVMKAGAHDFLLKDRLARLGSAIERELRDAVTRRERRAAIERLEVSEHDLRRAVQVRDEFLAIASHELRTPLTPLTLQLQAGLKITRAAREAGAPKWVSEIEAKLGNAVRYVERLTLLVANLLDVTRITSGHLDLSRRRVDLKEIVAGVAQRMRETMRAGELRLDAAAPVEGVWDPQMLESVVLNLLTNAVKYGQDRPIEVSVSRVGEHACLSVADHGLGIDEVDQRRIFERFERAVPSQHYGGFGIGLWVAARIVQAHGGTIVVESTKNVGSRFTVELPLDVNRVAAPASARASNADALAH